MKLTEAEMRMVFQILRADFHLNTVNDGKAHILQKPEFRCIGRFGFIKDHLLHIRKNQTATLIEQFHATVVKALFVSAGYGILINGLYRIFQCHTNFRQAQPTGIADFFLVKSLVIGRGKQLK